MKRITVIFVFFFITCVNASSLSANQTLSDCDSTIDYQERGYDLLKQEKFEDAIAQLNCAIDLTPQEPQNYLFRGTVIGTP